MTETQIPETNAVPYFPHQAPAPVPLTKRAWFLPVAIAGAFLIGAAGTGAVAGTVASVKAKNCAVAFEHADTALDAASNAIGILGDGIQAAARFDADALTDTTSKLDAETKRISEVAPKFNAARAQCEG